MKNAGLTHALLEVFSMLFTSEVFFLPTRVFHLDLASFTIHGRTEFAMEGKSVVQQASGLILWAIQIWIM